MNASLTQTRFGKFLPTPIPYNDLLPAIKIFLMYGYGAEFGGATWFLCVLFEATVLIKIVFTLCQMVARKIHVRNLETWLLVVSSILLWLFGYQLYAAKQPIYHYWLDLCLNAQFYFVLGLLFKKYSLFEKSKMLIFTPIALLGMVYFAWVSWIMMNWPTRTFASNPLHDVFSSLSGIYLTYVLSALLVRMKFLKETLIYLGKRSLAVLAFHFLGMKVSYFLFYYLHILPYEQLKQFVPPGGNSYWHILVVSSILFSLAVEFVLTRNPYFAALFFGKSLTEKKQASLAD
jgi:fucose 4-O-acetylase-like acetyltransferase